MYLIDSCRRNLNRIIIISGRKSLLLPVQNGFVVKFVGKPTSNVNSMQSSFGTFFLLLPFASK